MIRQLVATRARRALLKRGYRIEQRWPIDLDPRELEIIKHVTPLSSDSPIAAVPPERVVGLIRAVRYVVEHNLPGGIVECGVYRGASMVAIAMTLKQLGATDRNLYLCDTYEGMPPPGEEDVTVRGGRSAAAGEATESGSAWCYASLEQVRTNMDATGYPQERIHYVKGMVENTLPASIGDSELSLVRLDTDWYQSTRHELEQLFPRLVPGGVLIVDDYGHWDGARRAVDEYFRENDIRVHLTRMDYTGRLAVKQAT